MRGGGGVRGVLIGIEIGEHEIIWKWSSMATFINDDLDLHNLTIK